LKVLIGSPLNLGEHLWRIQLGLRRPELYYSIDTALVETKLRFKLNLGATPIGMDTDGLAEPD
jgi:hypothetical protein